MANDEDGTSLQDLPGTMFVPTLRSRRRGLPRQKHVDLRQSSSTTRHLLEPSRIPAKSCSFFGNFMVLLKNLPSTNTQQTHFKNPHQTKFLMSCVGEKVLDQERRSS